VLGWSVTAIALGVLISKLGKMRWSVTATDFNDALERDSD